MRSPTFLPIRLLTTLLLGAVLVSACSSSSDSSSTVDTDSGMADDLDVTVEEGGTPPEEQQDPVTPVVVPSVPDAVVPDPLVQSTTVVEFDITVPAYVSNALQVRVVWGDQDLSASWVGDELWSAVGEFPANTENTLLITFNDDNGAITLASVEQRLVTGNNELDVVSVTAEQFDTARWDSDNDGVSNLDELLNGSDPVGGPRVLLFSETRDYRHEAIESAVLALEELTASADIETDSAGDSENVFTDENLSNYDAVVWVLTSGDVLDAEEQGAFERYIQSGGGYAGIHAASDTEYDWPWYGSLVGAYFERHPEVQSARQDVEDDSHPSTAHLESTWTRVDEWYDYRSNPRAQVTVLLSLDEDSYSGGGMAGDHPSAWYHDYDGGRSWYTGGGHTESSYAEPDFRAHLLGGLRYAAGLSR